MVDDRARRIYADLRERIEGRYRQLPKAGDVCIVLAAKDIPGGLYKDDIVSVVGPVSKTTPGILYVKLVHRYPREELHRAFSISLKKLPPLVALAHQAPSKSSS